MSVQECMDGAFPSKACIKRAIDSMFEPNPDFHRFIKELKRRKGVRKKMAIDYGKEWQKLRKSTGHCTVIRDGTGTTLDVVMDTQIRKTIDVREELMEEYVKSGLTTNIIKQDSVCYYVDVTIHKGIFGGVGISRRDFDTWLKKRIKKGGKHAEH